MRLQLDAHTAHQLGTLRKAHPEITGSGHLPTIRWLLDYHRTAGDLVHIKDAIHQATGSIVENMPIWLEAQMERALRNLITNALAAFLPAAFQRPHSPENPERSEHREGRQQYGSLPRGSGRGIAGGTHRGRNTRRK